MKTLAEIYAPLGANELCDKGTVHTYLEVYAEILSPYRAAIYPPQRAALLEIGLFKGGSMLMWEEYFGSSAVVYGVDLCDQPLGLADLRPMIAENRHNIKLFDAANSAQTLAHLGHLTFNVIIEDASHDVSQQLDIYRNLKDRVAPGGLYVIEDIANIDRDRATFEAIDKSKTVQIIDRRHINNRFDDVLVLIR